MNDERADEPLFAAEGAPPAAARVDGRYKLLVVDDEEQVHAVTRMVLSDFEWRGKGLEILGARSAREGWDVLQREPDVAVILLDVVMESDHAGLHLARRIREQLGNRAVRIVLRTGQPGMAQERQVFGEYDIDDYRLKTELTTDKLYTAVLSGLRAFSRIRRAEDAGRRLAGVQERTIAALGEALELVKGSFDPTAVALLERLQRIRFQLEAAREALEDEPPRP